ncbi:oxidoreductase, partial [Streptomyces sp. NPDC057757]|uniref:oxidoreductase n=1 Tax=Streptomyces sp. NPDC057757 TaxID=3346241 RepID=UPI0036B7A30F
GVLLPFRGTPGRGSGVPGFGERDEVVDVEGAGVGEASPRAAPSTSSFVIRHSSFVIVIVIVIAGIMACPETRVGPGWEAQFATNHLGHYALVNRLWPAIAPGGARVVSVSSTGHHASGIRWDDPHWKTGYDKWEAYGQAKTANVLFAVQLDRLGQESGVRDFTLHPGGILAPLQRHLPKQEMVERGRIDEDGKLLHPDVFKSPEQGAATQVWAATSPRLAGRGGVYCEDCDIAEPAPADGERTGVKAYAIDSEQAARLWELSAELTGVNAFA